MQELIALCQALYYNTNRMNETDLKTNLDQVRQRITAAARRAGRDPGEVTLVAVSKTQPPEVVAAAYRAGQCHLGENRVEEAVPKIAAVKALLGPAEAQSLHWHMVGHLQRRKAQPAIELFDLIHSVDSLRLAERIERMTAGSGRSVPVLLEVNLSGEASKYGFSVSPADGEGGRRAFVGAVAEILRLAQVQVRGLMTMAPIVSDPEETRPIFRALRQLRDALQSRFSRADFSELSMGMTDDFEVAVEEGATMVRVGRAIFGPRR